jgi:uncharacterized protein
MLYRKFGKLDWKPSALGFGAMRLPVIGGDQSKIDEEQAIRMIRYAIDHGVNYLDTAYPYHNGQSERLVGKALKGGYREKIRLATKLPVRMVEKREDFDRFFNEQFERLDVKKLDYYLFHGLRKASWPKVKEMGIIPWAEKKMSQGYFDYLGFSFHDDYEVFKGILDDYDNWTFCQIQYNFMDVNFQAGRKGVEYAARKNLAIVVMEPLRGGRLAKEPPAPVANVWASAPQKRSPIEWAFQWLWNQPEISLTLSGMSAMQQVVDNVAIAERSGNAKLSAEELAVIDKVRDAYKSMNPIPCTGCQYCMPCPNGINIPQNFAIYNEAHMWQDINSGHMRYMALTPQGGLLPEERADQCVDCGTCMEACPQGLEVPELLKKVAAELGDKK